MSAKQAKRIRRLERELKIAQEILIELDTEQKHQKNQITQNTLYIKNVDLEVAGHLQTHQDHKPVTDKTEPMMWANRILTVLAIAGLVIWICEMVAG